MTTFTEATWPVHCVSGGYFEQTGYRTEDFGIHKQGSKWCVTHIPSGLALRLFEDTSLTVVKSRVAQAQSRFDWSNGSSIAELAERNHIGARAFYDACRDMARSEAA